MPSPWPRVLELLLMISWNFELFSDSLLLCEVFFIRRLDRDCVSRPAGLKSNRKRWASKRVRSANQPFARRALKCFVKLEMDDLRFFECNTAPRARLWPKIWTVMLPVIVLILYGYREWKCITV